MPREDGAGVPFRAAGPAGTRRPGIWVGLSAGQGRLRVVASRLSQSPGVGRRHPRGRRGICYLGGRRHGLDLSIDGSLGRSGSYRLRIVPPPDRPPGARPAAGSANGASAGKSYGRSVNSSLRRPSTAARVGRGRCGRRAGQARCARPATVSRLPAGHPSAKMVSGSSGGPRPCCVTWPIACS